jgi:hypothetical protein
MERTPLATTSPHFAYLEYYLQLCLHAASARITAAYSISNPHLSVQFEKRCKDVLTLDAWIDTAQLPVGNGEEDVMRKGFSFSGNMQGIKISVGSLESLHRQGTLV